MVSRGDRIFFAHPVKQGRQDGRLRTGVYDLSQADNVDWSPNELQITPDGFAYSSMALHDSTLHVVFEETAPNVEDYTYASLQYVQVELAPEVVSPAPDSLNAGRRDS